jgi:hypothetical protein
MGAFGIGALIANRTQQNPTLISGGKSLKKISLGIEK